ncbi:hypothetical protein ANK1_2505 [plant metagenome]|uniref:Uncharacterized protein n=1 Tax=plant metagenome TaxID=1297885 RepID=A0A484PI43_9ZZZZ
MGRRGGAGRRCGRCHARECSPALGPPRHICPRPDQGFH